MDSRENLNIRFVAHVGDIVENGDTFDSEWQNASASMGILEGEVP